MSILTQLISNQGHKQVPVKVTAYVDADIANLIEILNTFDGLWTTESCQGDEGEEVRIWAYYHSMKDYNLLETAQFVEKLAEATKQIAFNEMGWLSHSIQISLEWSGEMRYPYIGIKCSRCDVIKVYEAFCSVRSLF